jgi:enoyl-[acyl-carrier protein] reductase I
VQGRRPSILTMTYLGGERAVPRYNVMGVAKATLDVARALTEGTRPPPRRRQRLPRDGHVETVTPAASVVAWLTPRRL